MDAMEGLRAFAANRYCFWFRSRRRKLVGALQRPWIYDFRCSVRGLADRRLARIKNVIGCSKRNFAPGQYRRYLSLDAAPGPRLMAALPTR